MTLSTFGKGRPRKPRPLVDTTPRICVYDVRGVATVPLTAAPARETVTVVINGAEMVIDVVRDARHLGGAQRYFLCACGRRVWHLYLRADERPMCRRCAGNLDYRSRYVRRRGLNRVRRLREKIGAPPGLLSPIPSRPRYVRRDYWMRAVAKLAAAEAVIAAELHAMVPRVRRRLKQ